MAAAGDGDAPVRFDWRLEALREELALDWPGIEVEVAASLGSTSTALLERARGATPDPGDAVGNDVDVARAGRPGDHPTGAGATGVQVRRSVESGAFARPRRGLDRTPRLLVAERQTAGRGRQGRPWQSAPGTSLMASFAVPLAAGDWSGLSLAVGVALAEALDPDRPGARPRIGLKWPNDLWLLDAGADVGDGRKLGGILIETVGAGAERIAVVGFGVNIARFDPGSSATTGFASLDEQHPGITAPEALHRIAPALARALRRFSSGGFAPLAEAYARRDLLLDHTVTTSDPALPVGIARGVAPTGALRVETPDRGVVEVTSGEVSVRPRAAAGRSAVDDHPNRREPNRC